MMAFFNNAACVISDGPSPMVFVNYRTDELGSNFVSHLIAAFERSRVNFFVDTKELRGKDLSSILLRIEESKIALAIFSTRYSESTWCMNELVKMKNRVEQGQLIVIPIFFKVEPEDVRKPRGDSAFAKNYWRLAQDSTGYEIKERLEALEFISAKMGLSLREKSSEADFIKVIVTEVQKVIAAIELEEDQKD